MIPVRVFDKTLSLVSEIDDFEDAYYTRGWTKPGDFSLQINMNKADQWGNPLYAAFQRGYYIAWNNDPNKLGLITDVVKSADEGGRIKDICTVQGREALWLLNRRIVIPAAGQALYSQTAVAETVFKALVSSQCGAAVVDTNRKFTLMDIEADSARGISYVVAARYSNLLDEVQSLFLATGLSGRLVLNTATKRFTLQALVGVDRTAGQSVNGRAIFSTDYDTLRSAAFTDSEQSYANLGYVGGTGTGSSRVIRSGYLAGKPLPTDTERREVFIDASNLTNTTDLDNTIQKTLLSNQYTLFLEGSALTYSPLQYQTHWDLGDIATLMQFGQSQDARITEVREHVAPSVYELDLTFDRSFPELPSSISQQIAALEAAIAAAK